ncbi:uncharacterized protein [Dermacentor albipictus]|uniref:uncharacterized protein n=1 Tax=Dermacentor albipictus TaxID=60249 RepID=UPI0038FD0433
MPHPGDPAIFSGVDDTGVEEGMKGSRCRCTQPATVRVLNEFHSRRLPVYRWLQGSPKPVSVTLATRDPESRLCVFRCSSRCRCTQPATVRVLNEFHSPRLPVYRWLPGSPKPVNVTSATRGPESRLFVFRCSSRCRCTQPATVRVLNEFHSPRLPVYRWLQGSPKPVNLLGCLAVPVEWCAAPFGCNISSCPAGLRSQGRHVQCTD